MNEEQNQLVNELTKKTKMGSIEVRKALIKKKWDKEAALKELEKVKEKNKEKIEKMNKK